jgi:hypothetical protein
MSARFTYSTCSGAELRARCKALGIADPVKTLARLTGHRPDKVSEWLAANTIPPHISLLVWLWERVPGALAETRKHAAEIITGDRDNDTDN